MRRVGIIGYPLGHSVSPAFHQAAFDHHGLDVRFEVWETPPNALREVVTGLRAPDALGASVTVPHKTVVIPLLDRLSEPARQVGAVNLIVNRDGVLEGHNTDTTGFLRALREDGAFDHAGKRVLLLGSGGAARAVAYVLLEQGAAALTIANRTVERARQLVADLGDGAVLSAVSLEPSDLAVDGGWHLIVNCTTLGMRHSAGEKQSPIPSASIPSGALVCDLVYNPPETPLLREAKRAGARTLGGLPMLIYQGAEAFQLWTGKEAPLAVMFQAARRALASSEDQSS